MKYDLEILYLWLESIGDEIEFQSVCCLRSTHSQGRYKYAHICNEAIFTHVPTKGLRFEVKGMAHLLGNTLANWPYTFNIPKAGVTCEVCIMTHEWPGPKSQVPNMVRTQSVQKDCL